MRSHATIYALIAALMVVACDSQTPTPTRTKSVITPAETSAQKPPTNDAAIPLGQLPDGVEPLHYTIDLQINPDQLRYEGIVEIDILLLAPKRELFLHGKKLTVAKISAQHASRLTFGGTYTQVHESGVAKLSFDQQIPAGKVRLTLPFSAAFETAPEAMTSVADNGIKYVWTQFQEISARRAFPCFDEPRFKTPFDISVTTLARNAVISNTLPVSQEQISEGVVKTVFATSAPLPTYLLALAVGPYDIVSGQSAKPNRIRAQDLPIRAITTQGRGRTSAYALANTPQLIQNLEEYFAAPFPYQKLDLLAPPNSPAGGMENAGAITYAEHGLLLGDEPSVYQRRYFSLLHAHEIAHQWFGDLVTPRWWNDIWLNEAFASWLGNKIASTTWPQEALDRETTRDALAVMDFDALETARSVRQPVVSNDDIFNSFDDITYYKGAAILQMFESYQGEHSFREGVRLYMRRHAHGSATTSDFLSALTEVSKKPEIVQGMETFLNQPGLPLVTVKTSCTDKNLNVVMSQSPYGAASNKDARRWILPVCMRELGKGRPLPCTYLTGHSARFTVRNMCNVPLMPNMNGTGYYRFSMDDRHWTAMTSSFKKMNPAEQLATLYSLGAAYNAGETSALNYVATLRNAIANGEWDVIDLSTRFLSEIRSSLISREYRGKFDETMRAWFKGVTPKSYKRGPPGERSEISLKRAALASLALKLTRDPATMAAFSAQGREIINSISQRKAVDVNELSDLSLWAAMSHNGPAQTEKALKALGSLHNAGIRNILVKALAAAKDEASSSMVQEFATSGQFKVSELLTYMSERFADPDTRDDAWAMLKEKFKELSDVSGQSSTPHLFGLPATLCTEAAAQDVEKFLKPLAKEHLGAPRVLANTIETIRGCAGWQQQSGKAMEDAVFAASAK